MREVERKGQMRRKRSGFRYLSSFDEGVRISHEKDLAEQKLPRDLKEAEPMEKRGVESLRQFVKVKDQIGPSPILDVQRKFDMEKRVDRFFEDPRENESFLLLVFGAHGELELEQLLTIYLDLQAKVGVSHPRSQFLVLQKRQVFQTENIPCLAHPSSLCRSENSNKSPFPCKLMSELLLLKTSSNSK